MKNLYIFFILVALFIFSARPILASSYPPSFSNGLKNTAEVGAGYKATANPGNFLVKMLGSFLAPMMMGAIAMLILSYGGFTYMMARGDEQKVETAKAIITNTIIAIIVIFSAFAISQLILPLWEFVTKK